MLVGSECLYGCLIMSNSKGLCEEDKNLKFTVKDEW